VELVVLIPQVEQQPMEEVQFLLWREQQIQVEVELQLEVVERIPLLRVALVDQE
tara:strand:+ start:223 stop:384 length:162 start_codon:yes stop_codon:yes gene_type:complete